MVRQITMNIHIKRITNSTQLDITQFNTLLDDDKTFDEEQMNLFLANSDNALFVAFFDEKEVGFVTAYRLQRFDNLKSEVQLYEIGVDAAFQRKGIGSSLLSVVKNWAQEVGASEIWVLTEENNTAARLLYKSTGGSEEPTKSTMFTYHLKI